MHRSHSQGFHMVSTFDSLRNTNQEPWCESSECSYRSLKLQTTEPGYQYSRKSLGSVGCCLLRVIQSSPRPRRDVGTQRPAHDQQSAVLAPLPESPGCRVQISIVAPELINYSVEFRRQGSPPSFSIFSSLLCS